MNTAELSLEKELAIYARELPKLAKDQEGKFVLIHDEEIAGFWQTYEDAVQTGYEKFGLVPFLVKRVQAIEQVQYFTRDLAACH